MRHVTLACWPLGLLLVAMAGTASASLVGWWKLDDNASDSAGSHPGTNEWALGLTTGGNDDQPSFNVESGTTSYAANSPDTITLAAFHHIVGEIVAAPGRPARCGDDRTAR